MYVLVVSHMVSKDSVKDTIPYEQMGCNLVYKILTNTAHIENIWLCLVVTGLFTRLSHG